MTYEEIKNSLSSLCAQSEKAPQDIFQKAVKMGLDEDEASRLIDELTDDNFLNATRFAEAFASDKFRFEHWGKVKIRYALRAKGIPDSDITNALDEKIDDDAYLSTCQDLLRAKMRGMSLPLSQNDRAKLYRFLAQRGFEADIISKSLQPISNSSDSPFD